MGKYNVQHMTVRHISQVYVQGNAMFDTWQSDIIVRYIRGEVQFYLLDSMVVLFVMLFHNYEFSVHIGFI